MRFGDLALRVEFSKPALSLGQQLKLLSDRGLIIDNSCRAKRYLKHVGYYRLSAYMIHFYQNSLSHQFKNDTTFDNVLNLYIFDRKLRLLLLEAIERIEISFRSEIINAFAEKLDPHSYLDPANFDTRYDHPWLARKVDDGMQKSKEVFIEHYKKKYSTPKQPPVWMGLHLLTFKELVVLYKYIKNKIVKKTVAKSYGLKDPVLTSWVRSLSDLRNLCAHHSRVWNRNFDVKAVLPKTKPCRWLDKFPDLIDIGNDQKISPRNSLYLQVAIIWYFILLMNKSSTWLRRFIELCDKHSINMIFMGFPSHWDEDIYWQIK